MQSRRRISLDATLAPELVDFWGQRYHQVKEELEDLKRKTRVQIKNEDASDPAELVQQKHDRLEREYESFVDAARRKEGTAKAQLDASEFEKSELARKLTRLEAETAKQRQTFFMQANYLALEADRVRQSFIDTFCPRQKFIEADACTSTFKFADPQNIIDIIPQSAMSSRLCFLPRPPTSMPLRVQARGRAGYWFHPLWSIAEDAEFELVVEGRQGEWTYLGRYVTSILPGHDMRLSEWIVLDENTKAAYALRIANQNAQSQSQFQTQSPSSPSGSPSVSRSEQLAVKQRYETGEWVVPCYTLRCVGFDVSLYRVLCDAATGLQTSSSSSSQRMQGPGQNGHGHSGSVYLSHTPGASHRHTSSSSSVPRRSSSKRARSPTPPGSGSTERYDDRDEDRRVHSARSSMAPPAAPGGAWSLNDGPSASRSGSYTFPPLPGLPGPGPGPGPSSSSGARASSDDQDSSESNPKRMRVDR